MLSSPSQPEVQHAGGLDASRLDTNQQARALPIFCGRHWFPVFWAVQKIHNYRETTKSTGGGKGGKSGGKTTTATCDVAGVVAACTADFLEAIKVNNEIVWSGGIERDGSHPEHTGDIVVPNVGTFRFHWGTETASGDFLVLNSIGEDHPYYRGQPVLEAKGLACGTSGSPSNLEVLTERAARFAGLDEDRSREGANGITFLAEVLGDDFFGLGMPEVVDGPTAALVTAALAARQKIVAVPGDPVHTAYMSYLSVFVTERQTFGSLLAAVLENFDGWARRKGEKLEFGYFDRVATEPAGLLELSLHDFVSQPNFGNPSANDPSVITDAIVTGPDRDWDMQGSWQIGGNDVVRDRIQETRQKTFARDFLCTSYQQKEQAQELANFYGVPARSTSQTVRRAKVAGLRPGDRFIVNYAPSTSRRVFRCKQRTDPARGGEVQILVEPDRSIAPLTYIPAADPAPARPTPPAASAIVNARMFPVPSDWAGSPAVALIPLASRPAYATFGFRLHFSETDTTYDDLLEVEGFAIRGTTVGTVSAGAGSFTLASTSLDISLLQPQSAAAQADDTLLAFIGNEVLSLGASSALGGGQYSCPVLRARRGSAAAAYGAGTEVYILPRSAVDMVRHAQFPRAGGTKYFKLQGLARGDEQDLSTALKLTVTFADTRPTAPTGVTATPFPGVNRVTWTPATSGVPADEWNVYRDGVLIADNCRTPEFDDLNATPGVGYTYTVSSEDFDDVEGPQSAGYYCVTAAAPISVVAPTAPSAASISANTAKITDDGVVRPYLILSIPAKPANAEYQEIGISLNTTEYTVKGNPRNTATTTFVIDDLQPNTNYYLATRSRNPGAASAWVPVTGGNPVTTGSRPTPAAPTGVTVSTNVNDLAQTPVRYNPGGGKLRVAKVTWTAPSNPDLEYYELQINALVSTPSPYDDGFIRTKGTETTIFVYNQFSGSPSSTVQVRQVTSSGVRSAYTFGVDFTPSPSYGTGTMADQNNTSVDVAGGKAVLGGLEANVTTAVDVKAVNLRVYDSGGTQRMRVDNTTGELYVQSTKVLSTRVGSTPSTLSDVISVLQHHGLSN